MSDGTSRKPRAGDASGFALILAILALMLLTFLGLTLAATTSTELQIATNYRWGQQALYNAEAGIEAAKVILQLPGGFTTVLPDARPAWTPGSPPSTTPSCTPCALATVDEWSNAVRNWANGSCDASNGKVGYGAVLHDGTPVGPYQYKTTLLGQTLNGAVTLWVRRPLVVNNTTGQVQDYAGSDRLVLVAEGVAPYSGGPAAGIFANQAVRVVQLEVLWANATGTANNPCMKEYPGGGNFGGCSTVDPTSIPVGGASLRDQGVN